MVWNAQEMHYTRRWLRLMKNIAERSDYRKLHLYCLKDSVDGFHLERDWDL